MVEIYRVFHRQPRKYTFFSVAHGNISRIDERDDVKNKRNHKKYSNSWRLNNTLLKTNE
jgi:hypothetical protein